MVPSRFLQRLKAFAGAETWGHVKIRRATVIATRRGCSTAAACPAAAPSRARSPIRRCFPRTLSVTEIETLVRDPTRSTPSISSVLTRSTPSPATPGAADRGTHPSRRARGASRIDYPRHCRTHALENLLQSRRRRVRGHREAYPELYAEWWPRLTRLATHSSRGKASAAAPTLAEIHAECSGARSRSRFLRARPSPSGPAPTGSRPAATATFAIVDFKTGQPPSAKEVSPGSHLS